MTKQQIIWTVVAVIVIGAILIISIPKSTPQSAPQNPDTIDSGTSAPLESINPNAQTEPKAVPVPESKNRAIVKDGMKIEVQQEGSGPAVQNGQTAVVNYTGTLANGTTFDSNVDPSFRHVEPFSFTVGAGQVIKGWDEGVAGMKIGETRKLTIPPELAYGSAGAGGVIPPNATLTFVVTLTAIK